MKPLMTIDESFEIELDHDQLLASSRKKSADVHKEIKTSRPQSSSKTQDEQQRKVKEHALFLITYVD